MKTLCATFLCMLLMCGCSSTYTVGAREAGADVAFSQLGAEFGKQEVTIILTNEEVRRGTEVVCLKDSTTWRESLTTVVRWAVPRSQVYVVERMNGKNGAVISFTNGEQESADGVVVTADSVSWIRSKRFASTVILPTSQIKKIIRTNRLRGFIEGMGIGPLTGGVAGFLVAAIIVGGSSDRESSLAYPALFVYGAGAGLLAGPVIGLVKGHSYEYEFPHQSEKQ